MRAFTTIPAADGAAEAIIARPDDQPHPGVLLCMDAIGLRARIEEMADRIASWGYIVLAPNTFYRSGPVAETTPPADADLRDPRQRADYASVTAPLLAELTGERMDADVPHYVTALRDLDGVASGPIGVTGYCMGAKLATRVAGLEPSVAACGGFHGAHLATAESDSPHLRLSTARAAFVYGHADQDPLMPAEDIARLDAALAEHSLIARTGIYPEAPHGYSMSDTASYQAAGAQRHFDELRELLDRELLTQETA